MLYFAYGSNLHPRRLQVARRAPGARLVGVARLRGWEVRFHKRSHVDLSAKADIVPSGGAVAPGDEGTAGNVVLGALYRLEPDDEPRLDRVEGLGIGYDRRVVTVETDSGPGPAFTYVGRAEAIDADLRPLCWYRDLVVAGALFHRFPAGYVERLRGVAVTRDADRERRRRELAVLGERAGAER